MHNLFDPKRHDGKNAMAYFPARVETNSPDSAMSISSVEAEPSVQLSVTASARGLVEDDEAQDDDVDGNILVESGLKAVYTLDTDDNQEYIMEDDDDINIDAYAPTESDDTTIPKTEQGGVAHLVHGWIQQRQPEKVRTR